MNRAHRIVAVSMGDMNGIGPEVLLKVLSPQWNRENPWPEGQTLLPNTNAGFIIVGSHSALAWYCTTMGTRPFWRRTDAHRAGEEDIQIDEQHLPAPGEVVLLCTDSLTSALEPEPGMCNALSGSLAMKWVSCALHLCIHGHADALVTGPISKEAIHMAGYTDPGHTEYLARLTHTRAVGMVLANERMRIGLATIHHRLSDVAGLITKELLEERIEIYHQCLERDFGIPEPTIAVMGLNPHAGDGGVLGLEELDIIAPVVKKMVSAGMNITGPFPADGFFGSGQWKHCDLVLAMYHDQGLIPVKLTGFGSTVNISAGLPIVRTSPDHGTAFSIAGQNRADAGSMHAAVNLALQLAENRKLSGI